MQDWDHLRSDWIVSFFSFGDRRIRCCHFSFQKGTNWWCGFFFFFWFGAAVEGCLWTFDFKIFSGRKWNALRWHKSSSLRALATIIHCVSQAKCDRLCRLVRIYLRTSRYHQVRHSHVRVQHGHDFQETTELSRSLDRPWWLQAGGHEQNQS